ncbi:MAG: helix-turn-helix domain-containing protein [Pseudomonadota bacterium]|nr:helix-turn-helix domain-containing protein [Pseudomonadota bacterium]
MDYVARTPHQLGQVLKSCRQNRRLTQAAVGSKVGIRQSQISAIEGHGAKATVETLYKMLSALGLELVLRDLESAPDSATSEW